MERFRRRGAGASGPKSFSDQLEGVLNRTLGVVAAIVLICLVGVTCVDVVGRYFLDAPLAGAFEITEVLLAALVFSALPLTTERREHVEVDLLQMLLSERVNRFLTMFGGLFSMALLATLAWRLFSHALGAAADGATTNALGIPLAPFGYLAAVSCLVSAGIAFLRGVDDPNEHPEDIGMEGPL